MKNPYRKQWKTACFLILAGLAAGVVNGLFGTGGGIIIVFLLSGLYAGSADYHTKDIFAMTVGAVFIMSAASLVIYLKDGALTPGDASPYLIPAAVGGVIGAFALDRLDATLLKKIFAALVVYAGITLMFR